MNLLEDFVDYVDGMQSMHVKFVDTTMKQNTYFEINIISFVIIASLFSFYVLFKYLNE